MPPGNAPDTHPGRLESVSTSTPLSANERAVHGHSQRAREHARSVPLPDTGSDELHTTPKWDGKADSLPKFQESLADAVPTGTPTFTIAIEELKPRLSGSFGKSTRRRIVAGVMS